MHRSLTIKLLAGLVGFTALAAIAGTAAWFVPTASLTPANTPIEGETMGAYFAYGDGSAEKPYGITKPRHVYNLSWLQYLGMFNQTTTPTASNYGKQYHFEVAADIPMGGLVIPPIGTTEYPFVGEIKGQDHIISGFKTSNSFADFVKHPAAVTSGNFKNNVVKIVGFFGVVGNYGDQFSGEGITYSSAVNTISDLGLTDFEVKTVATDTLIGMAAGYVDATIDNIAVDLASINVATAGAGNFSDSITTHLSDYSIIGYSTNKQKVHRYSTSVYNVTTTALDDKFTVEEQDESVGWGGSLNMVEMYGNLKSVWNTFGGDNAAGTVNPQDYVYQREVYYDTDGNEILSQRVEQRHATYNYFSYTASGQRTYYKYFGATQTNTNSQVTSSYTFVIEPNGSTEKRYMCLSGERDITITNEYLQETTHAYEAYSGHRISYSGNYLSHNNSSIINETTAENAMVWNFNSSAGTLATCDTSEHAVVYLTCDSSGNLSLTSNASAIWSYDSTNSFYVATVNGVKRALGFDGANWTMSTFYGDYYEIKDNNDKYVGWGGGTGTQNLYYTSIADASNDNTKWIRTNNRLVAQANTNIYLSLYTRSSPNPLCTYQGTNYAVTFNGTTMTYNSRTQYPYQDGSHWYASTSSASISYAYTPITLVDDNHAGSVVYSASTYNQGYLPTTNTTSNTRPHLYTNATYFPLKHTNGVPESDNTGYVVSGSNAHSTSDPWGDIRVSMYEAHPSGKNHLLYKSINETTHKLSTVYTINNSTTAGSPTTLPTDLDNKDEDTHNKYPKYYKALKNMNKALGQDTSNIYGLHFMNAVIGGSTGNQRVNVGAATINGSDPMVNYPLPTDCIDFNLKERGAITFFAGTYFVNGVGGAKNNSFFSLYDIQRNPSTNVITSLKEIYGIYKHKTDDTKPYIYQYSDGTFSDASYSSLTYSQVFDTTWIKAQSSAGDGNYVYRYYSAYYFEIPMNEGEYALGSVSGGTGAYLMYLDIGANAKQLDRTIFGEKFQTIERQYEYPTGVAFVKKSDMGDALKGLNGKSVDAENSACIVVYETYNATFKVTRTSDTQIDINQATGEKIKGTYICELISLHDPGGALDVDDTAPMKTITTTVFKTDYFDYDAIREETTRSVIKRTMVTVVDDLGNHITAEESDTKAYEQYFQEGPSADWESVAEGDQVLYKAEDGSAYASRDVWPMQDAASLVILAYNYATTGTVTAQEIYDLTFSLANGEVHYGATGFNIEVKSSDANRVTVDVIDPDGAVTTVSISVVEGANGVKTVTITILGSPNTTYTVVITPTVTN